METRDLLLEIGTEEIPARMLLRGIESLEKLINDSLALEGLSGTNSVARGTPRRLSIKVTSIPSRQDDREELALGPSVNIAFGPDGTPTRPAEGFAKGQGVNVADLERVDGPKGQVIAVRRKVQGSVTIDVLRRVLPQALSGLNFPKAMRWGNGKGPFVRPVHWVLCLFGTDVVKFDFMGLESDRLTWGHRFLSPDPFQVPDVASYDSMMESANVVLSPSERRQMIVSAMKAVEDETGHQFIENQALIDEVSNIIEKPHLILGKYDPAFLRLPPEVLVTAMGSHQRYFAMVDGKGGTVPSFGVVSNNHATDMTVVSRGNERVLSARLYDAAFFWDQDLATGIEALANRLGQRMFLQGAGTMADKAERLRDISVALAEKAGLHDVSKVVGKSAELCKADLMSAVVNEFPELQGVMGEYYAREAGLEGDLAHSIREHYLPRFAQDDIPETGTGAVLALADRFDSILTAFGVGAIPTGSKDPLALRRQAIGVLRILAGQPKHRFFDEVTLDDVIAIGRASAVASSSPVKAGSVTVEAFFEERFRGILMDDGIPTDIAGAVTARLLSSDESPSAPIPELVGRAKALSVYMGEQSGFGDFLDSVFKRVGNILKKADSEPATAKWRDLASGYGWLDVSGNSVGPLELEDEVRLEQIRMQALSALADARDAHDHKRPLEVLFGFGGPLADFFGTGKGGVPVLIENNEAKRTARLALLHRVQALFAWYCDFSRISTR